MGLAGQKGDRDNSSELLAVFEELTDSRSDPGRLNGDGSDILYTTSRDIVSAFEGEKFKAVLHGRIDNEASLREEFGVSEEISRAELIVEIYREEGEKFQEELLGSYTFVIYDLRSEKLLLGRDATGLQSLYYSVKEDLVIFSTEISALIEHEDLSCGTNREAVASYLKGEMDRREETFYQDIKRLPPDSTLVIDEEVRLLEHCSLKDEFRGNSTESAKSLREVLEEPVKDRLEDRKKVGVLMSGGLDSTAVASIAYSFDRDVEALSMLFDRFEEADERERISDAAEEIGLDVRKHRGDEETPSINDELLGDLMRNGPCVNPNSRASHKSYVEASENGFDILLSGGGGNILDGSRLAYADMLRNGELEKFVRTARNDSLSNRQIIGWCGLAPLFPRLASLIVSEKSEVHQELLAEEYLDREVEDIGAEVKRLEAEQMLGSILSPEVDIQMDIGRKLALKEGIELRYPYMDERVLRFVAHTETGTLFGENGHKTAFRQAFSEDLPESIIDYDGNETLEPLIRHSLCEAESDEIKSELDSSILEKKGIVKKGASKTLYKRYRKGEVSTSVFWRYLSTEIWLSNRFN
ncbi:MAG: asparagine synthase-related protein [Candidatus Nanohaloarchaea archaeon]